MQNVVLFCTTETSAIDTDPIQTLKKDLGEKRCRVVVDGMIFEITDLLCQVERRIANQEYAEAEQALLSVSNLSCQLGLVCLTDITCDLMDCMERGDTIATNAVAARLIRLGEDSLFSLIEFTNRSII